MKKIFLYLIVLLSCSAGAQNADIDLLNSLYSYQTHKFGDPFFKGVSSTTSFVSLAAPISVFSAALIKKDKALRYKSYQMVAGMGLSISLCYLLKYSINRPRPGETYPFIIPKIKETDPSFPSGHTTSAFETATSLSLNFPKWYVIVPAYAWAGTVAYSRMYLGVHYPSDIAGGILLGAGSAWLTWKLNQKLQKRKTLPKE